MPTWETEAGSAPHWYSRDISTKYSTRAGARTELSSVPASLLNDRVCGDIRRHPPKKGVAVPPSTKRQRLRRAESGLLLHLGPSRVFQSTWDASWDLLDSRADSWFAPCQQGFELTASCFNSFGYICAALFFSSRVALPCPLFPTTTMPGALALLLASSLPPATLAQNDGGSHIEGTQSSSVAMTGIIIGSALSTQTDLPHRAETRPANPRKRGLILMRRNVLESAADFVDLSPFPRQRRVGDAGLSGGEI